jgi:glycosyltransferase involved in cell wall biosynthesis
VNGRFPPAYDLAGYLDRRGALSRLITPIPRSRTATYGITPRRIASLQALGGMNYAVRNWMHATVVRQWQWVSSVSLDAFASRQLAGSAAFNGWVGSSLLGIRAAHRLGIPAALTTGSAHILHQDALLRRESARFRCGGVPTHPRVIERALVEYEESDVIVVPSPFVWSSFVEYGVSESKLALVPWAATPVTTVRRKLKSESGELTVLFVGGCTLRKGIPYAFDAFRGLRGRARLRMAGTPDPGLFRRLGGLPDNVDALGVVRGRALADEFENADVFLLPSIEDGSALVILEAMVAGLPVIVSDHAGAALIEDGVSGFIVPAGDVSAIIDVVTRLAADPALRADVGLAAQRIARARTVDVYGEEFMREVYESRFGLAST